MRNRVFDLVFRILPFAALFCTLSCNGPSDNRQTGAVRPASQDSVVAFNHGLVEAENQEINDFIARYHWKMNTTGTGLRYMIYRQGTGEQATPGSQAGIVYSVHLLNGDTVYSSPGGTVFSFEPGKRRVTSGLEEGVMLMSQGSRAKLILPSHLAFGLLGDMEKIPSRAVLVYDVELCTVGPVKK